MGLERQHLVGRGAGRHDRHRPQRREQPHHRRLDPEVVGHGTRKPSPAGPPAVPLPQVRVHARFGGGDAASTRSIPSVPVAAACPAAQALALRAQYRSRARHRAGRPHVAGQSPRVDTRHGGHTVALQERLEALGGPPVRRHIGQGRTPPRRGSAPRRGCFVVGRVGPVVANVGAGERDHLAGVRRVGDHLLITAHRRVEDELARRHRDHRARGLAGEHRAVRRDQEGGRPLLLLHRVRPHRCATASTTTGSPRRTVWRTAPPNVRPA